MPIAPRLRPRSVLGWLRAPAVQTVPRASAVALAVLRVLAGLLWLYNVRWKGLPDFGRSSGGGLYGYTTDAVDHPVFAPYSWLVEHLVLPNFTAFGWLVLVVETALAVLLLTGALVRLAALLGIGQSLVIGLSVAQTPGEWPWAYAMMVGIHLVLLSTPSGATASVDAVRASRTDRSARALLAAWGLVGVVVGLAGLLLSIRRDPTASSGSMVGSQDLQVSLGSYNVLGAGLLLGLGVLMVAGAGLGQPLPVWAATVLAVLAALSLYTQLGRAEVWLGGTNTSAALLVCTATVAGTTARSTRTVRPG